MTGRFFLRAVKTLVRVTLSDSFRIRPPSELVYSTETWTNGQSRRFGPGRLPPRADAQPVDPELSEGALAAMRTPHSL